MLFGSDNKMDKLGIKSAYLVQKLGRCRNRKTNVESLKHCFSVGRRILTCTGVDKVFVGHKE